MSQSPKKITIVPCPTCDKDVEWSDKSPFRPFCSERCRLIDLGEWVSEGYRIEGEEVNEESASPYGDEDPILH